MLYIAHRGYSLKYKDNSVEGIRAAIERGYDGVEIDVQLCKDGRIVLYHDVFAGDRFVSEMTYETLAASFGIQTLDDLYNEVPEIEHALLFVDIKGSDTDICVALDAFYKTRSITSVYFCSFNRKLVSRLPVQFKKGSTFQTTFLPGEYDTLIGDIQVVVLHWTCLDQQFIEHCKHRNVAVFTFTHKEPMELSYMKRFSDVTGIITNGLC
jgi:glycerophosphoryl diester phosphodiesterase